MLSLWIIVVLFAQAGAPLPNPSRQGPLLVAEEVFSATVMSVEDGDSIVVMTGGERMSLDLAGVDAPEMSQASGPQAKEFLSGLTLGKTVTVRLTSAPDRLARLSVKGTDVSEALIRAGMGWHCPRFADDRDLINAEADARSARRGLWSVAQPMPPWLFRGAGACGQQAAKPKVSSQTRPDFSGTWTAVSPSDRAGQKLRITQDAVSVTLERISEPNPAAVVYKLNGATSRALITPHGPVDIVAKVRWDGSALVVEERRWTVAGEEATNLRQVLWVDDRGLLNFEVSSPQPIGERDVTTLVMRRDAPPSGQNDTPGDR
jgi:micrococcal nuclease